MSKDLFQNVLEIVESWEPDKHHNIERDYRDELIDYIERYLKGSFSILKEDGRSLCDIGINNEVGIELKLNLKGKSETDRLVGQIDRYKLHYEKGLIVLLLGDTNHNSRQDISRKIRELKENSAESRQFEIIFKDFRHSIKRNLNNSISQEYKNPADTLNDLRSIGVQLDTSASDPRYIVKFETSEGLIIVELDQKLPITTENFKHLVKDGFYNGVIFHRIIDGFMIQGGDPTGTGRGGPGYTIKDEFPPGNKNNRGTISMANAGPNTGGSQFFINLVNNNFLDGRHPAFGAVIEGMDIVDAIGKVKTGAGDRPVKDVVIVKAELV